MCSFIKSISKSKYLLKLNVHFCLRSIIGKEWGNLRENLKKMPRKRREEEGIHGKQAKSLDSCFANFWSDLPTGCCFYLPKYQAQICHWRIIENLFWSWIEPLSYAHGQKNLISLERLWAFLFSSCYPLFTKFKRLKQTNIWKWNKPPISTGTKTFFFL